MFKPARHILTLLFLLVFGCTVFGQVRRPRVIVRRPPNYDQRVIRQQQTGISKIEAVRENYIGQRLNLTTDEAQKFWPIYRRYQDGIKAVRRLKRLNNSSQQANGADQIRKELYYEGELVNIRKFYTDEFLKILSPDKVSVIFKSEREFSDELIKQLAERNPPVKS